MAIRVVGAGLGRTGTMSLKVALERLLGGPVYHMTEVFANPDHVGLWHQAAEGQMPDWEQMLANYQAVVDWPAASFWPELAAAFPESIILLSVRDPERWWESASQTIFPTGEKFAGTPWHAMFRQVVSTRFHADLTDREGCLAAYARHYARARAEAPPNRLVVWQASDGWEPLCRALGVPVPEEPFPRTNTREEFAAMHGGGQV